MVQPKQYNIGIIGLGYVGLPLAKLFIEKGHTVYGIDVDLNKIEKLKKRESYLSDFTCSDIEEMFETGNFIAGSNYDVIRQVDCLIICVPTPLNKDFEPDLKYVKDAMKRSLPYLHAGQLVILESSTYPGTTEEELKPLIESQGFQIGRDISLAYSPERIDPGSRNVNIQDIPKVVGGVTETCTEFAKRVYESIFNQVFVVSSPKTAEMMKLLENSQRYVNISFMNDLVKLCEQMDINLWEVIQAASTKPYGFTPYFPGPGVGGHCIPIDPLYLLWKAKKYNIKLPFIELSHQVNQKMPQYVIEKIEKNLQPSKALNQASILVIGVTYKKDVNDLRESTALVIIKKLQELGAKVNYHDPYIEQFQLGLHSMKSVPLSAEEIQQYDCTLILTDHSNIDYQLLVENSSLIIDTRNCTSKFVNLGKVILL